MLPRMATDAHAATEFYLTAQGAVALRLLRARIALIWPDMSGLGVLGIGHAAPYLRPWRDQAARCIAAVPEPFGPARWPADAPSLSCTVEDEALPFADLSLDRVLLVHGLEAAGNARRLLREVWRVLRDDGRLLVVTPNRVGLWAHVESTPFGQGQPYSPGQIDRLLASSLFKVERRETALYMPPLDLRVVLRAAGLWEAAGRRVMPRLAGVTLAEAVKDAYAGVPVQAVRRRRLVMAEAG